MAPPQISGFQPLPLHKKNKLTKLVRLFKIAKMISRSGFFDKLEEGLSLHPAVLKLLKLATIMAFCAHLFACVLYALSDCKGGGDSANCWAESYCVGGDIWFDGAHSESAGEDEGNWEALSGTPTLSYRFTLGSPKLFSFYLFKLLLKSPNDVSRRPKRGNPVHRINVLGVRNNDNNRLRRHYPEPLEQLGDHWNDTDTSCRRK
jgi:hypothetical protein